MIDFKVKLPLLSKQSKPNNLEQYKADDEALVLEYYNEDLPSPSIQFFNRNWNYGNDIEKMKMKNRGLCPKPFLSLVN